MISRRTSPADLIKVQGLLKEEFYLEGSVIDSMRHNLGLGVPMFTVLSDEEDILAIVCYTSGYEGVLELTSIFTVDAYKHRVSLGKFLKRSFVKLESLGEIHRLQATVRENFLEARRFIEFLGFTQEGVLKKYGADKSNYIMYGKVK